jgi:DNA phosphorothioation-associated putative methyltransferase
MSSEQERKAIARHKTAIKRQSFSLPVKCMLRDGLLHSDRTFFDYGCGHGQDLAMLSGMSIQAAGWDPVHRPDSDRQPADVVNLGYVINVIEDPRERQQVIRKAWELCKTVLTVAAQVEFAAPDKIHAIHGDGILTSWGTFQKYYNQYELRDYLQTTLETDAISAAPGVFYIFKDEEAKQQFVANKYHRRLTVPQRRTSEVLFEQNNDILEPFMAALTQYGRIPGPEELPVAAAIEERFGSLVKAFRLVQKVTDEAPWKEIAQRRTEDLLVYLALARFRRRPPIAKLPLTIQRDIKAFLGTYAAACEKADELLFLAGNAKAIDAACQRATVGQLVDNALTVHESVLPSLEPLLRIYEGCARALVGSIEGANLIKLHRHSGKVSYIVYPDFETVAFPKIQLRVKVALRSLAIDVFDYSNWPDPPVLFRKDEVLPSDHPKMKLFKSLSTQLKQAGILPSAEARFTQETWAKILTESGYQIRGHKLVSSDTSRAIRPQS